MRFKNVLSKEKSLLLKGWKFLSEEERKTIKDVFYNSKKEVRYISYLTKEPLLGCLKCKIFSPESFSYCPNCGISFLK